MRHSLYANNSRVTPGNKKSLKASHNILPTHRNNGSDDNDRILEARVKALLKRYRDNQEITEDIKNAVGSYVLNVSVARNLGSEKSERQAKKDFSTYLHKLEKGEKR